jgi:hypothetical protein
MYDEKLELSQIFQLTNNGRRHDFQPSQVLVTKDGSYLVPGVQTEVRENQDSRSYPAGTGKLFVRGLSSLKTIVGTVNVADYPPVFETEVAMEGGRYVHLFLDEEKGRLYTLFDSVVTDDPTDQGEGGDGTYKKIMTRWFDVKL